jgi:hypothetical protein
MRIDGVPPAEEELAAYCQRLRDITGAGGQLKLVQIYTLARAPAESYVTALSDDEVRQISQRVRRETGLETAPYFASH